MAKVILILVAGIAFLGGWLAKDFIVNNPQTANLLPSVPQEKPLEKYTIDNLSASQIPQGKFTITEDLSDEEKYTSHVFELKFSPDLSGASIKQTTGQVNFPKEKDEAPLADASGIFSARFDGAKSAEAENSSHSSPESDSAFSAKADNPSKKFPLIIMLRGYVDQAIYKTGDGTRNASFFFAENGFITIAPDFLGYGGSDEEAGNIFETRFQTYTTVLSLIKVLDQIEYWDKTNVFIWAHSNGGQITLTVLEITGENYPTVLWAPVTKPFPYSILYYTDGSDDGGKLIRSELAKFENNYDTDLYSLTKYLDRITSPIQIHQGTLDDAVPVDWSRSITSVLKEKDKDVSLFIHSGADHNMRPSWDVAIEGDLKFFRKHLKD